MRQIIVSTLVALSIAFAASASYAGSKACYASGKAYVSADVIAGISTQTGEVYLLSPENNWGKGSNTSDFLMTRESDGRYSISESKFKTGEGHPARVKTGRASKAEWPANYSWSNATPGGKHLEFEEGCK